MVELLLGREGKKDFVRFKKTVIKELVDSDGTTSITTPRVIAEDSFKFILDKFMNQTFKDFAASYQVNHLW